MASSNDKDCNRARDRELGMDRDITRRDFLNGMAIGAGGVLASAWLPGMLDAQTAATGQDALDYYPPTLTGMRGSHPGSFEIAHAVRDGDFWEKAGKPVDTGENYDLIVVGTKSAPRQNVGDVLTQRSAACVFVGLNRRWPRLLSNQKLSPCFRA